MMTTLTEHDLAELRQHTDDFLALYAKALSDSDVTAIRLAIPEPTRLKHLNLSRNQLTSRGIEPLAIFRELTSIDLWGNPITDASALRHFPKLTHISLNQTPITADSIKLLAQFPFLRSLELNDCILDAASLDALANSQLTHLSVDSTELDCDGATRLACSKTLIDLSAAYNDIGTRGAQALGLNKHLLKLNVYSNTIDALGAKALGQHPSLMELNIQLNEIGDEGIARLAKSHSLMTLYANCNNITDDGARALLDNLSICELCISDNELSENMQLELQQHIKQNAKTTRMQRDDFVRVTWSLVDSLHKPALNTYSLSADMLQYIFSFMSSNGIGKSSLQTQALLQFMLNHYLDIKEVLADKRLINLQFLEKKATKFSCLLPTEGLFKVRAIEQTSPREENNSLESPSKKFKLR